MDSEELWEDEVDSLLESDLDSLSAVLWELLLAELALDALELEEDVLSLLPLSEEDEDVLPEEAPDEEELLLLEDELEELLDDSEEPSTVIFRVLLVTEQSL